MTTLTPKQFARAIKKAGRELVHQEISRTMTMAALDTEARAKLNATNLLRVRSGRLRNSIVSHALFNAAGPNSGWELILKAGNTNDVRYARIQEEGGTIRAKNAKFLAIPLDPGPAVTGAGVSRYSSPRQVPGLHVQGRGQRLRLVDGEGRTWYVLRRSVNIKPKLYLRRALDHTEANLPRPLAQALLPAIDKAGA